MPDRDAHQEDQRGNDPRVFGTERQRVVVRQHQENDWKGQVVVVGRAQLGNFAVLRIGRTARFEVCDHDPLVGHDDQEYIRRHDRRGESTKVKQRRATCENLVIAPRHRNNDPEEDDHHQRGVTL